MVTLHGPASFLYLDLVKGVGALSKQLFVITCVSSIPKHLEEDLLEQEQLGFEPKISGFKTDHSTIGPSHL